LSVSINLNQSIKEAVPYYASPAFFSLSAAALRAKKRGTAHAPRPGGSSLCELSGEHHNYITLQ